MKFSKTCKFKVNSNRAPKCLQRNESISSDTGPGNAIKIQIRTFGRAEAIKSKSGLKVMPKQLKSKSGLYGVPKQIKSKSGLKGLPKQSNSNQNYENVFVLRSGTSTNSTPVKRKGFFKLKFI